MRRGASAGALALAIAASTPAFAQQVTTRIVPDTAADRSTGTVAIQQGSTTIIDGGTRVGTNLFHSFTQFDVGTGALAVWLRSAGDGASISNVVNRVTGGAPSTIDGTIATYGLPNANFYFINPSGVVFGANAQIQMAM